MKKILIILGLILSCNIANATSVTCWEEYTTTQKTPEATSAIRTAIAAAGGESYLVSTMIEGYAAGMVSGTGFTSSQFKVHPIHVYSYYTHSRNSALYAGEVMATDGDGGGWSGRSLNYAVDSSVITSHFVHTYCTVNSSSGSGGGTILSAPVVFLIKATS